MIKKICNRIASRFYKSKINWLKTIYVNFMMFPFRTAIKLPLIIYGPCKIGPLKGKISINGLVQRGLISIGASDPIRSCGNISYLEIFGNVEFEGFAYFQRGIRLSIKENANVYFGDNVFFGDNCTIVSFYKICIEKNTRIGNNVTIMDTDFHFVINVLDRNVKSNQKEIHIGKNNWIAGWTVVKKGAKTPEGTIVAGPFSMIGKNYIDKIPAYSLIGGSPAKLLAENVRRVNNSNSQIKLAEFFKDDKNAVYHLSEEINLNDFCVPQNMNSI